MPLTRYACHMRPILTGVKHIHERNKSQLCSGLLAHKTDHQIKSQPKNNRQDYFSFWRRKMALGEA